jgi:hypothetical protein
MSLSNPPGAGQHECPGGCGTAVKNKFYACRSDWYRLPQDLRRPINTLRIGSPEHLEAQADGMEWFRNHPPASPAGRSA